MTTEPNKDAVTKEENKVDIIMDSLNDGVTETKIIDCLISNNQKIETDFDLDQLNLKTTKNVQILTTAVKARMAI